MGRKKGKTSATIAYTQNSPEHFLRNDPEVLDLIKSSWWEFAKFAIGKSSTHKKQLDVRRWGRSFTQ